jgi:hypothetical protein
MIEIMRFRLAAGVDEEAFKRADGHVQSDFAYHQPGLLRRTTARSHAGGWIVIDLWQSESDADAAATTGASDPVTARFMSLVDPTTVETERYDTLD